MTFDPKYLPQLLAEPTRIGLVLVHSEPYVKWLQQNTQAWMVWELAKWMVIFPSCTGWWIRWIVIILILLLLISPLNSWIATLIATEIPDVVLRQPRLRAMSFLVAFLWLPKLRPTRGSRVHQSFVQTDATGSCPKASNSDQRGMHELGAREAPAPNTRLGAFFAFWAFEGGRYDPRAKTGGLLQTDHSILG